MNERLEKLRTFLDRMRPQDEVFLQPDDLQLLGVTQRYLRREELRAALDGCQKLEVPEVPDNLEEPEDHDTY